MILANARNGSTVAYDIESPVRRRELSVQLRNGQITGLSILSDGHTVSLPCPKRFQRRPTFGFEFVEGVAERVFCQAGGVRVSLTRYLNSPHVRCDLVRTGQQRYNPAP